MLRVLSTSVVFLTFAACSSWVQLTAAGQQVEIRSISQVSNCEPIGRASSSTMDRLLLIERSSERQQNELFTLARNEAGDMGGNVIVATNEVTDGQQRFDVYRCPQDSRS